MLRKRWWPGFCFWFFRWHPRFASGLQVLPLCGAALTFLCGGNGVMLANQKQTANGSEDPGKPTQRHSQNTNANSKPRTLKKARTKLSGRKKLAIRRHELDVKVSGVIDLLRTGNEDEGQSLDK